MKQTVKYDQLAISFGHPYRTPCSRDHSLILASDLSTLSSTYTPSTIDPITRPSHRDPSLPYPTCGGSRLGESSRSASGQTPSPQASRVTDVCGPHCASPDLVRDQFPYRTSHIMQDLCRPLLANCGRRRGVCMLHKQGVCRMYACRGSHFDRSYEVHIAPFCKVPSCS